MITLVDGLMGSGKSYYAVHYIHSKKDEYYHIYTNIDGFKFSDNIKPLQFSWLLGILDDLKLIYDDESKSDQDLWDYLYSIGFLNSNVKEEIKPVLIVLDEAHNEFDAKNNLLTWFITYHRHLFIDAIFITQTYTLIHYSYHKLFENILHAIPASKQLFTFKFKYQKHIKLPISDGKFGTYSGDIYLKKDPSVFALYQSGDKVRSKSFVKKYLYYLVGFAVLALFGFFYVLYTFTSKVEPVRSVTPSSSNSTVVLKGVPSSVSSLSDSLYLRFDCFLDVCTNKENGISFSVDDVEYLLKNTDSKFLRAVKRSGGFASLYVLASPRFMDLFKNRSEKDEKGFSFIH